MPRPSVPLAEAAAPWLRCPSLAWPFVAPVPQLWRFPVVEGGQGLTPRSPHSWARLHKGGGQLRILQPSLSNLRHVSRSSVQLPSPPALRAWNRDTQQAVSRQARPRGYHCIVRSQQSPIKRAGRSQKP